MMKHKEIFYLFEMVIWLSHFYRLFDDKKPL